jgi:trimethylamine--corrinoid protein Co-methyltransferase
VAIIGRLELVTESELDEVHGATLEILEKTGIVFNCEEALGIFKKHGLKVDGKTVLFRVRDVEGALKTCPPVYDYRARNSKNSMKHGTGQEKLLASACYGSPFMIENGKERPGTAKDYINLTKLLQASSPLTVAGGILTDLSDVEPDIKEIMMLYYTLKHSDKPVLGFSGTRERIARMFRMVRIAFDQGDELWNDRVMSVPVCPTSPLKYEKIATESLIAYAEKGQPVYIVNCLMAGISSPVAILGTAVQQNCEFLAGLVLAQLVHPGVPVVYVPGSTTGNMKTASYANGSPEGNLCNIIGLQLAYKYKLPNRVMSGITDSKAEDYQAGLETMQNHLLLVAAGAQYLHNGVGTLDSLMAMSEAKFVLDSECIERVQVIMDGVRFSREDMRVDQIMEVGSYGNHLMHEDTLENFNVRWRPGVSFSDTHKLWEADGSRDVKSRAEKLAAKLIAEAPEEGFLDPAIDKKLKAYIASI